MLERFPDDRDAVARTGELADRLRFDLTEELGYRYPDFSDGDEPAIVQLRRVCERAFAERYSGLNGHKRRVLARLDEELALIGDLGLAGFFLLHWEVLELAREVALDVRGPGSMRHVLPPGRGRGSSVGSLVCYLTGLSHVDPVAANLSLGRFLNRELTSVPDIDLDFPRDIREQLIVRVTEKYGREHAALVATFSTYRSRGAIRDVGKALGLPFAELERLARVSDGWSAARVAEETALLPATPRSCARRAGGRSRAVHGDRRPAAAHLPASGRDGHLDAAARRTGAGAAVGDGRPADVPVGQGLVRGRRLPQDRPARSRDAVGGRGVRRPDRAPPRRADRPVAHPARRSGGVRRDPERRHGRLLPDREPRADAVAAAHAAREPRRPHRAGRARPAWADPGEGGAPVHRAAAEAARGPRLCRARGPSPAATAAARHARRRRLPGPGARRRRPSRRLHRRRGGGAAARDEPEAEPRGARGVPRPLRRRRARERRRRGDRAHGLRQADRLLRLRLPQVALGRVRAARVPVGVAAPPLRGGVPRVADERAADGLLPAVDARPRRAAARRGDAAARRERQRGALRPRRRCRARRAEVRAGPLGGRCGRHCRGTNSQRAVRLDSGPGAARSGAHRRPSSSPARATASASPGGICCGSSDWCRVRRRFRVRAARREQLALPLEPTAATPDLPEPTVWERMLDGLPDDEPLHRRAPARADAPAPARGNAVQPRAARPAAPARRRRSPAGRRAPAAGDRERRSSSCCSRTSTRRST